MCLPVMAAAAAGLQMAGQVANFSAQQDATNRANEAALVNARDASLAATHKYEDEGRKVIYDARQTQQEGYKAVMAGRVAKGQAMASAGASGFDASSISIGSVLAAEDQKIAQNEENVQTKMDDLSDSYRSRVRSEEAEAQGRINSMPMKAGPNPLALGINLASSAVSAFKGA